MTGDVSKATGEDFDRKRAFSPATKAELYTVARMLERQILIAQSKVLSTVTIGGSAIERAALEQRQRDFQSEFDNILAGLISTVGEKLDNDIGDE